MTISSQPSLQDWMLNDFRQSAIPDALTTANVQILTGDTALQVLLEDKIAQLQTVNSYVTLRVRRLLDVYDSLRDGLWCTRQGIPYAKPIHPRCDPHRLGKSIKYETPPGAIAAPILPSVDRATAAQIYERYNLTPDANQSFWDVVEAQNIPVAITEGLKKALSLLAHGIPARAVRGITQWHLKGSLQLHAVIDRFATQGRRLFIVFDQDTKPKTMANVHRQVKKLGTVLAQHHCQVRCPIWSSALGKGIDDVLYNQSTEAQSWLDDCFRTAPTLKQYQRTGRIAAALNTIHRYNALTFPVERTTDGGYLPPLRIDSETNDSGTFTPFFNHPDHWLQQQQPDVLILSPSAKSGISIEGGAPIEAAYFDEVWAYFPALHTDTHLQLLGRYRPPVARRIFIPPFITSSADGALGYPRAVHRRLTQNLGTLARLFDIGSGDRDLADIESAIVEYLTIARTVSGSQKAIAQAALIDRLEQAEHQVGAPYPGWHGQQSSSAFDGV